VLVQVLVIAQSLCMSVTSQHCIESAAGIKLVFGMEASFDLSCTVIRKFRYLQKCGYFPLELCPKHQT